MQAVIWKHCNQFFIVTELTDNDKLDLGINFTKKLFENTIKTKTYKIWI